MAAAPADQPPSFGQMRCSTADRERAIDVLKAAFAEGRLDMDEYADRVGKAHASRTYGDLAALTADLPVGPLGTLPAAPAPVTPGPAVAAPGALTNQAVTAGPAKAVTAGPAKPVARRGSGRTNELAFFAMVFGIIAVAVPWAAGLGIVAVLSGLFSLSGKRGRFMAIAAIVLGLIAAKHM
jgi:Domain of unknown function (DUF1707)